MLVLVLVPQLCPTLRDPMDCNPPGFSVHEIFQARILEWVAISFSRGFSQPRDPVNEHGGWGDSLGGPGPLGQCVGRAHPYDFYSHSPKGKGE